ncbi:hypothetical protein Leryth_024178 [Lithospermum erythrorhizon]|nr:hypothetical protein Leryth_024178 [Lithospermum erythrorhizon]
MGEVACLDCQCINWFLKVCYQQRTPSTLIIDIGGALEEHHELLSIEVRPNGFQILFHSLDIIY